MINNSEHHDMDESPSPDDGRAVVELLAQEHRPFLNVVCPCISQRYTGSRVHGISGFHGSNGSVVCWMNRWSQDILQNNDIMHQTMIAAACKREALILET